MAEGIPSKHPRGYWMANSPAGIPSHAYPNWLLDLLGSGLGAPPAAPQQEPEEHPMYPVPYGPNGNVLANYWKSMRRSG